MKTLSIPAAPGITMYDFARVQPHYRIVKGDCGQIRPIRNKLAPLLWKEKHLVVGLILTHALRSIEWFKFHFFAKN